MRFNLLYVLIYWVLISCSNSFYVTPVQYGALPDGKSDCTEPIQRMLHDMKKNKIYKAKFPTGNYLISDGFTIDFPCSIIGNNATVITKDTLECKYAFKYSLSKKCDYVPNKRQTELSLNFKIHGVPVAFHGYNNIYMHDCNISTFTGTNTYYKNTKFWFAINCDRMYDAHFKNIHFDQPVNYRKNQFNSADGLHITGCCHDIIVENLSGHCGDDFIALNSNEDTPGDIYNITIKNCDIGSDTISKNGIRIYGGHKTKQLCISNILIEKCRIRSDNSPCLYLTNAANGIYNAKYKPIIIENFKVKKCKFFAPKYDLGKENYPSIIRIGGVNSNYLLFDRIKGYANTDIRTSIINYLGGNIINKIVMNKCEFQGDNFHDLTNSNQNVVFYKCKFKKND